MTAGPRVLVLASLLVPVGYADAQTPPWPGESGTTPSAPPASAPLKPGRPWPSAAPQDVAPMPGMSPMMGAPRPVDGGAPQCMAEFTKLREAVEKKGMAAKAAGQRHVTRKEMCEYITAYAAAEARWIDFTEAGVQTCGIPAGIVNRLQEVHANTERTRVKVCADSVALNGISPLMPRVHMDDFTHPSNREFFPLGDWGFPEDLHRR